MGTLTKSKTEDRVEKFANYLKERYKESWWMRFWIKLIIVPITILVASIFTTLPCPLVCWGGFGLLAISAIGLWLSIEF